MTPSKSEVVNVTLEPTSAQKRGRPSQPQQLKIEQTLREFFAQTISATIAARKTGYDIKTVTKYYRQIREEIQEGEQAKSGERYMESTFQVRNNIDETIHSLYQDKKDIENIIEQAKINGDFKTVKNMYGLKLKINQDINKHAMAKTKLTYNDPTPTLLEQYEERQRLGY